MKNKIVIADTGPIMSLSVINRLSLLISLFGEFYIATSVWKELLKYKFILKQEVFELLEDRVVGIKTANYLSSMMDEGESESVIL